MRGACGRVLGVVSMALLGNPALMSAQGRPELKVRGADQEVVIPLRTDRGFAGIPLSEMGRFGWRIDVTATGAVLVSDGGSTVVLRDGSPFFDWDHEVLQLSDAPYVDAGELVVPVQLVTDFVPRRGPGEWTFEGSTMTLSMGSASPGAASPGAAARSVPRPAAEGQAGASSTQPEQDDGVRVVVIDPGHGGNDPGTLGPGQLREKDVALGISLALAAELERIPFIEVHLIRDEDVYVPPWDRGVLANDWKGERPGLFVSIHANSSPNDRSVRGFETYFLSEARTEHERRVVAIENAPFQRGGEDVPAGDDLGFILRELATLDHQHWSSLLAELVQEEVARFHPGPNRGVKQGSLAVITNSLMPAVLVEIGYLSNSEEGPLLFRQGFQRDAARSIARAVERFFERYPPGTASGAGEVR